MKTIIAIIISAVFFISCDQTKEVTPKKPYENHGYDVQYIRGLWLICYQAHQRKSPFVPPQNFIPLCDCVIDKTRSDFTRYELDKKKQGELTPYFLEAQKVCFEKMRSDNSTQVIPIPPKMM